MHEVLAEPGPEQAWLTAAAAKELAGLREAYAPVLEDPLEALEDGGVQWHTFAGGAINRLLAAGLAKKTRSPWVAGNLSVKAKDVTELEARRAMEGDRSATAG
jgi:ATP-dependent Lhr-like helicase